MKRSIGLVLLLLMSACPATIVTSGGPPPRGGGPPPHRPPDRDEPRILTGRVYDKVTGQPLERASVDISSSVLQGKMTITTDNNGHYRSEPIPVGDFNVRCRRSGYESEEVLHARVDHGTAIMDCPMTPVRR